MYKQREIKRQEELFEYWETLLDGPPAERRELSQMIETLYKYNELVVEKQLKPLQDFIEAKPDGTDINDPQLTHKASQYVERQEADDKRFRENYKHDCIIA